MRYTKQVCSSQPCTSQGRHDRTPSSLAVHPLSRVSVSAYVHDLAINDALVVIVQLSRWSCPHPQCWHPWCRVSMMPPWKIQKYSIHCSSYRSYSDRTTWQHQWVADLQIQDHRSSWHVGRSDSFWRPRLLCIFVNFCTNFMYAFADLLHDLTN